MTSNEHTPRYPSPLPPLELISILAKLKGENTRSLSKKFKDEYGADKRSNIKRILRDFKPLEGSPQKFSEGRVEREQKASDPGYSFVSKLFNLLMDEDKAMTLASLPDSCIPEALYASPLDKASDMVKKMIEFGFSQLPIVEEGLPVGIIRESDLLDVSWRNRTCGEVMSSPPPLFSIDSTIAEIKTVMRFTDLILVPQTNSAGERIFYVITRTDLLRFESMKGDGSTN